MTPDLGQGACQALEDAVELATAVREVGGGGVATALRRYERLRRPRTAALARQSSVLGRVGQLRNPWAAGGRDLLLRLVPSRRAALGMSAAANWEPSAT
jgi:2-polyprenyl-6-methoxyphenol hydroxylase-like FAD-dependent oxidoreductase